MPSIQRIAHGVSIIIEPEPHRITMLFSDMVTGGRKGLYITRRRPREVKLRPERGSVKYVWLSSGEARYGTEGAYALGSVIERFLDESEGGVVAVDGIDFLSPSSDRKWFTDMLDKVSHKAQGRRSFVLVQTPGGALSEEGRAKLARATGLSILAEDASP